MAEYKGGKPPLPTLQDLIELVRGLGERNDAGRLQDTASGECVLGTYGTAIFRSQECPHTQLWLMSNGYDFVLASLVCNTKPEPEELKEAQEIVAMIGITE
jgi:hypothetical protein